jgi:peptidoglycan/LPS O-acetylase OafA/YrhL
VKTDKRPGRIPELDGLRVLMIFIVSWYHIWQQSWLSPSIYIESANFYWSLDFLVRTGYVWVDGTVLLSAFLMYLPLARKNGDALPETREFYFRKAKRILPGYWFIILLFFFTICLPWNLYNGNGAFIVKDLFTHFTLIFPFWKDTYIFTPLGAASWTLSIVAQGYLLFPLLARCMRRKPAQTLVFLAAAAFAFRAWCLWGLQEYSMVVNTFVNFLDVYAIGFGGAMLFARAEKALQARNEAGPEGSRKRLLREAAATAVFIGCFIGICELLKVQSATNGQADLQGHQMMFRPLFALGFAGLVLSAPFSLKFLRFLLGNRVTAFLSAVSMNYYLVHQTLAVHLKRIGFPPSVSETPNMAGEQPWQWLYTLAAFGFSLVLAILITYLVEKPAGKLLQKYWDRKKAASGGPGSQEWTNP